MCDKIKKEDFDQILSESGKDAKSMTIITDFIEIYKNLKDKSFI